ncbi:MULTISPECIES: hypothetical protein [Shouchella]|uniref:Uncharacterized protein n=1 Tax=Shouchella hunanensis TaxID=766894 RepID=A0ABY7W3N8_9BACI|nr:MULTISPECIES: hypothetical protein [Shouchella]WDF02204.1 hypothetical protein PQ477_11775 [Shouchella hunanensis]
MNQSEKMILLEGAHEWKRKKLLQYVALIVSIVCFLMTFITPTRIVGSLVGDYSVYALTAVGVVLSSYSLRKAKRKHVPTLSLVFSLSLPIYIVLTMVLLFTGIIDVAP